MKRPVDIIRIESVHDKDFAIVIDRTTQFEVTLSLRRPSMARFELGDEGTWASLRDLIRIGGRFAVSINGKRRVTGRMLTRNMPVTATNGATVQLVIQTVLADAAFTACMPGINVRNVTLKALVLKAFERLGLTEDDFVFRGDVARDAITGRKSGQPSAAAGIRARLAKLDNEVVPQGVSAGEIARQRQSLEAQLQGAETRPVVPDLEEIQVQEANVQPGETIRAFVERHLARHGMSLWDSGDGKIVVGRPDDSQEPVYVLSSLRGPMGAYNNLVSATRTEDYENVPTHLWVYGRDSGKGYAASNSIKASQEDPVLTAVEPPLDRVVTVVDQSIRTQALAEARARREMLNRSIAKDNWALELDGLSYWSGRERREWAIDAMADLRVDTADRADGAYLIHEVIMSGSADAANTTRMMACAKGIWNL